MSEEHSITERTVDKNLVVIAQTPIATLGRVKRGDKLMEKYHNRPRCKDCRSSIVVSLTKNGVCTSCRIRNYYSYMTR